MRQPLRRRASSRNLNERLNFGIPELDSGASAFEERSDPYDQDAYPQLPPLRRHGSDASLRTTVRHPTMTSLPQLDQGAYCDEDKADAGSTSSTIAIADSAKVCPFILLPWLHRLTCWRRDDRIRVKNGEYIRMAMEDGGNWTPLLKMLSLCSGRSFTRKGDLDRHVSCHPNMSEVWLLSCFQMRSHVAEP
jgi:hypothetical protein